MRNLAIVVLFSCVAVISCSTEEAPEPAVVDTAEVSSWATVAPSEMTDTQKLQQELCLAATNAMASELFSELTAALDTGDPTNGITVCGAKAPGIAHDVGAAFGVKIGRTSTKLRNPNNTAPDWAVATVTEGTGNPTYLTGPEGAFGALLPIRLKSECRICHGDPTEIDEGIQQALAEHYPEDQAIGFAEGDLRGWFWVEAPPVDEQTEAPGVSG